jgi:hypothetical protein
MKHLRLMSGVSISMTCLRCTKTLTMYWHDGYLAKMHTIEARNKDQICPLLADGLHPGQANLDQRSLAIAIGQNFPGSRANSIGFSIFSRPGIHAALNHGSIKLYYIRRALRVAGRIRAVRARRLIHQWRKGVTGTCSSPLLRGGALQSSREEYTKSPPFP